MHCAMLLQTIHIETGLYDIIVAHCTYTIHFFLPDPAREELHELLIVHVQQLVEIHPAVSELAEGALLLQLGRGSLK